MVAVIPPGELVYGMQLPIQSLSVRVSQPWERDAGRDELAAVARAADRAGFFYVAVCDHVAIPREPAEAMSTTWWDTVATLGWLAALTERVRLLSHVYVLPYRHPLVAAKAFTTLDVLSGGRTILGVGAGHVEGEFDVLGVPFASRGAALDEGIDAVRAAFADEYPTHAGERWRFADVGVAPRPVQAGGPPIWVGGSSAPAIRRAAIRGDGWLPQGPPKQGMAAAIATLRELRRAHFGDDRPIDIGVNTEVVHVGEPWFEHGSWALTGEPGPIAERLRRHAELGVNQLQLTFRVRSATELCDQIEAFGAQVAPLLR